MPHPKVKIADNSGNEVSVTNNKLDVNAVLSASDNIEIGNVDIKLNGTGVSADEGNADAGTIRMTIADDDNHFGAIGTASDVDGNIHGQLRYIGTQSGDSASFFYKHVDEVRFDNLVNYWNDSNPNKQEIAKEIPAFLESLKGSEIEKLFNESQVSTLNITGIDNFLPAKPKARFAISKSFP